MATWRSTILRRTSTIEGVKVVALDDACRQQQVDDKCFAAFDDVPTHALTLTVPRLLAVERIFCCVPGPLKREAVRRTLEGPIDGMCPASALRLHPHWNLYLDIESAGGLSRVGRGLMKTIAGRDPQTGRSIEVAIEDGRIASIRDGDETETAWLSAGLVDLQINGYGGCDLNAEGLTPEVVVELARRVLATGVTTFLATLISAPEARIIEALAAIAEARRRDPLAEHMIAGVHMEGAASFRTGRASRSARPGVSPPAFAREFDRWQAASGGLVRMVTVSPHFAEAPAYIAGLRARGVHVSIGHTHCSV